ncbi:MAG: nucleoside-diphosphate kinase [Candidatus Binatia bacterium]|nr:nucleoside-diphosphate kinase [Candidatus Binatia bacterium]
MIERTLSIIKPEAVAGKLVGEILRCLETADLRIIAAKLVHLTQDEVKAFYVVHKDRPFYGSLTEYMSSGPIFVSVLEGESAISRNRVTMGATDPAKAASRTIRKQWGKNVEQNAVHGSDGLETAAWGISFFFKEGEIHEIRH